MVKQNQFSRLQSKEYLVQALHEKNRARFRSVFLELHPTDQVEFFGLLNKEQRETIYQYLSPAEFAEIFQGLELREQKKLIFELEYNYAVEMFNNMFSDDVADFLGELDDPTAKEILKHMSQEDAHDIAELLAYPEETAGAIMTTEFIAIPHSDTVPDVLQRLRQEGPEAETIYYLYVVDHEEKLVGVVSLRELIVAQLEQQVKEIMNTHVISVTVSTDQEEVVNIIKDYNFLAVPVVDNKGVLVGIVTVDDVIDVLEDETTEDFGEISAVRGAVDLDISSGEASKRRLPWLIILLFVGMISAGIIGSFEATLEEVAILAVFIPLIAGMAGNTGTQSLAVVVRGLALGKFDSGGVIRLLKRETGTGIIMGFVCGIAVSGISQVITGGNLVLGFIVGFSLFCTLIAATLAGSIVPLIIHRFEIDPAVASGPFITTINDIIGLLIYFSIARAFIDYL